MKRLLSTLTLIIFTLQANALGNIIREFQTQDKVVALTFDDGPNPPYTEQLLDILSKHNVKATFYVCGASVQSHPKTVKRIIEEGHDIGNHSMHHHKIKNLNKKALKREVLKVDEIIRQSGYKGPITFRAPYGQTSKAMHITMVELNKPHILFNYLFEDWLNPSPDVIKERVMKRVKPGFIITLHDGGGRRTNTLVATAQIIRELQSMGYGFKTVSQLLNKE